VLDAVMGLRITEEEEAVGIDLAQHNERGYNL
jgi:Amt family ammonium transporter